MQITFGGAVPTVIGCRLLFQTVIYSFPITTELLNTTGKGAICCRQNVITHYYIK